MRIALASDHAAVSQDPFCAGLARSHSNTKVGKYRRRVDKVREISERHLRPLPPA